MALAITSLIYFGLKSLPKQQSRAPSTKGGVFYVTRAIDGDTIKLSDGRRVRLIGIDTPELHFSNKLLKDAERSSKDIRTIQELGRRAAAFTKNLCLNKKVRLEYDVQKKDKYRRTLAYVYLEDGTFVNAKILEEGYGQVMTIPPNVKHADYFVRLEKGARGDNRGLWSDSAEVKASP